MYYSNCHRPTKMMIFNISNQLKHILSKALVAQWVHRFSLDINYTHLLYTRGAKW